MKVGGEQEPSVYLFVSRALCYPTLRSLEDWFLQECYLLPLQSEKHSSNQDVGDRWKTCNPSLVLKRLAEWEGRGNAFQFPLMCPEAVADSAR